MWHITELDIQTTLEKVCHKVTHDHSVTQPVLQLRAKALYLLGETYLACGVSSAQGLEDLKSRITKQMRESKETHENKEAYEKQQEESTARMNSDEKSAVSDGKEEDTRSPTTTDMHTHATTEEASKDLD